MTAPLPGVRVVIVDADTVAGWRRVTPSLAQLESALSDLRRTDPNAVVAILGDPALKWALPAAEQERLDDWINHQMVVLAPAGTKEGHVAFIAAAARKAVRLGMRPVAITDRAVPDCPIAPLRRDGDRWAFDLDGAIVMQAPTGRAGAGARRRRGPRGR
ncbi:MAG: hypothetical protein ACYC2O_09960 [Microthrixaceae bacterium]